MKPTAETAGVTLTKFRRRAAPLAVMTLIVFLATLLPPRRASADDAAALGPISGGTGGPSTLGSAPVTPESGALVAADPSTGAAEATYAFRLPVARGLAQPRLNLAYNSSAGPGFAGVGWSLDVLSIVRKGAAGLPRFNFSLSDSLADVFMADGVRLVSVATVPSGGGPLQMPGGTQTETLPAALAGVSLSGATYFRKETDDSNRYFLLSNLQTWLVQTRSGHVLQFGQPTDGQAGDGRELPDPYTVTSMRAPSNAVYRWNLVRDTDASSNNTVYYLWTTLQNLTGSTATWGIQYLSDIFDTPQPGHTIPASAAHRTHLTWSLPAGQTSTQSMSFANAPVWRALPFALLTGVDVTSATYSSAARNLVRRYHLTYIQNGTRTRNYLNTVTLEGTCASAVAELAFNASQLTAPSLPLTNCPTLPPTTYTYTEDVTSAGHLTQLTNPILTSSYGPTNYVDIDGDSMADSLSPQSSTPGDPLITLLSTDVRAGTGQHKLWSFGQLSTAMLVPGTTSAVQVVAGDWQHLGNVNWMYVPTGTSGQYALFSASAADSAGNRQLTSGPTGTVPTAIGVVPNAQGHSVDVDGDGLPDTFLIPQPSTLNQSFSATLATEIPDGNGAIDPFGFATAAMCTTTELDPTKYSLGQRTMADIDGDGLRDLVVVESQTGAGQLVLDVLLNHGDGRFGAPTTGSGCGSLFAGTGVTVNTTLGVSIGAIQLADVTGDGVADIVGLGSEGTQAYVFVCAATGPAAPSSLSYQCSGTPVGTNAAQLAIADFNGDGIQDIAVEPTESPGTAPVQIYPWSTLSPGITRPGLLTKVDNGYGGVSGIVYDTAAHLGMSVPVPTWVVTSISTTNGLTGPFGYSRTVRYTYASPVYDPFERTFLGFQQVTTTTPTDPAGAAGRSTLVTFATAACPSGPSCADPQFYHALRGIPVLIEEFDGGTGLPLRTTWNEFRIDAPNGHSTRAYPWRVHRYLWDGQNPTWQTEPIVDSSDPNVTIPTIALAVPTGGVELRRETDLDLLDNVVLSVDYGSLGPVGPVGTDQAIVSSLTWALPLGDTTGWNYRNTDYQVGYGTVSGSPPTVTFSGVSEYRYQYYASGLLQTVQGILSGSLPLPGPSGSASSRAAGAPANASSDGTVTLATLSYDAYGNVSQVQGADGRCVGFVHDALFSQLQTSSLRYTSGCGSAQPLETDWVYDRGLGQATMVELPHQSNVSYAMATLKYDPFGRLIELDQPDARYYGSTDPSAAMLVQYSDTPGVDRIHVQTVDGPAAGPAVYDDHYQYIDGFGAPLVSVDRAGSEAGTSQWVVSGAHQVYRNGALHQVYKPSSYSGDGSSFPVTTYAYAGPTISQTYDGLGRRLQLTDYNGGLWTWAYHSLLTETKDAEQSRSNGPHVGAKTDVTVDGHGRVVQTVKVLANRGALGANVGSLTTQVQYLATGEPFDITLSGPNTSTPVYSRWMIYDSLGRMVFNEEPNTTPRFWHVPLSSPAGFRGWTYAYDDAGDLVGTSDARGCGENFFYDNLGRLRAEDFSGCTAAHHHTIPNPTTGDGTEAFYNYDAYGRLQEVDDLGGKAVYGFDARNRVNAVTRWLATTANASQLSSRYAPGSFTRSIFYSEANRPVDWTTGADVAALSGSTVASGGKTDVTAVYNWDGTIQSIGGSYGTLLASQTVDPMKMVTQQVFGDVAGTTVDIGHDANENVSSYWVHRNVGPWLTTPGYTPASGTAPDGLQYDLTQLTFTRDRVGNPTLILDAAPSSQWQSGYAPLDPTHGQFLTYADDYRLIGAVSTYATSSGSDTQKPIYTAGELSSGLFPAPVPGAANRVAAQDFYYDWHGNISQSIDDQNILFDRSLGKVTLKSGTDQIASAGNGVLGATYDAAGNLTALTDSATNTSFAYAWDEVGRLASASRSVGSTMAVSETYAYDASNERVRTSQTLGSTTTHTVNVFDSLVLENASYPDAQGNYVHDASTENLYLGLPGNAMAHAFYADDTTPTGGSGTLHVYLDIGDPLGSSSFVVDHQTGELVEHPTYQVYGGAESDYRPERWDYFRESVRHTGNWDNAEVGLIYRGQRYYSPQLGRFISPDPVAIHGLGSDSNPYAYAGGSPLVNVDPDGLGFNLGGLLGALTLGLLGGGGGGNNGDSNNNPNDPNQQLPSGGGNPTTGPTDIGLGNAAGTVGNGGGGGSDPGAGSTAPPAAPPSDPAPVPPSNPPDEGPMGGAPGGGAGGGLGGGNAGGGGGGGGGGGSGNLLGLAPMARSGPALSPEQKREQALSGLEIGGGIVAIGLAAIATWAVLTDALEAAAEGAEAAAAQTEANLTKTVAQHATDIIKRGPFRGELARPYVNSPLTIQEIMGAAKGVPDPGGVAGALRWDVPGAFRGAEGVWELVFDPATNTVLHFNFVVP